MVHCPDLFGWRVWDAKRKPRRAPVGRHAASYCLAVGLRGRALVLSLAGPRQPASGGAKTGVARKPIWAAAAVAAAQTSPPIRQLPATPRAAPDRLPLQRHTRSGPRPRLDTGRTRVARATPLIKAFCGCPPLDNQKTTLSRGGCGDPVVAHTCIIRSRRPSGSATYSQDDGAGGPATQGLPNLVPRPAQPPPSAVTADTRHQPWWHAPRPAAAGGGRRRIRTRPTAACRG